MSTPAATAKQTNPLLIAFISVTTLFFAWGFITSMNDPLIPAIKAIFSLNYAESLLTQFAFFIAYGVASIPGSALVARIGFRQSIVFALSTMIVGCLCIPLATHLDNYLVVLVALFIIASGITVLQVAANPLSAALGPPERSHFRLTLSQAFNSLGTVCGPWLGSKIMLSGGMFSEQIKAIGPTVVRQQTLHNIDMAYLVMTGMLLLLVLFVWRMREHLSQAAKSTAASSSVLAALKSKWALFGATAIFFYVGAEVSVASIMINFLHQPDVLGVPMESAGTFLSWFYWGGAMVGRFAGSYLLTRIPASRLLTGAAAVAAMLCFVVSQLSGPVAGIAALAIGFFNSIMFPVIFSVTLERSTANSESTSGLLCVAIVGGALLPPLAGKIADNAGLHFAFFVPLAGYALITLFAIAASRAGRQGASQPIASMGIGIGNPQK